MAFKKKKVLDKTILTAFYRSWITSVYLVLLECLTQHNFIRLTNFLESYSHKEKYYHNSFSNMESHLALEIAMWNFCLLSAVSSSK